MPTLLVGDYFFVSKYAYGYSHYSLPFSPRLFSGRIFGSAPLRGDVVVFRLPKDDTSITSSASSDCPATASRSSRDCCTSTTRR
jgi:signal peptidase I